MTKTDLIKGMRATCGSDWIDTNQVMTYCGYKSRQSVTKLLNGLPRFNKKYSIYDLADRIMANYGIR